MKGLSFSEWFRPVLALLCLGFPNSSFALTTEVVGKRLETIPDGEFLSLKQLVDARYTTVCVIPPYAESIKYSSDIDPIVNQYLSNSNYRGDESYWSLVLLKDAKVTLITFHRSSELDLFSSSEFSKVAPNGVANFSASNCTSFEGGGFLKVSFSKRSYVVLGERK